jgi:cytochrome b involved in lipid metabolism
MKHVKNGSELAREMGVPASRIEETITKYNAGAKANNDEFGKKFFANMPFEMKDNFWVAIITPVVHYCMGGVKIDTDSAILNQSDKPIPGLFAAGEICGGVHGKNRLGGSSLLGCVVFGRVAGDSAARYLLSTLTTQSAKGRLDAVSGHLDPGAVGATIDHAGVSTRFQVHPQTKRITLDISWDEKGATPTVSTGKSASTSSAASAAAKAAPAPAPKKEMKEYTLEEVAQHKTEQDCWVVVNGEVLAVSPFLKNHPGGKQAILLYAGKDATAEFNMLHKKDVVQKYAPDTIIGTLKGATKAKL